jgi:glycosyltransferase involved in cell wall biosynthesis
MLIEKNIPFIWLVFTNNDKIKSTIKGIIFMSPELKITDYIADSDYLVQFSKTEADCLSVKESLCVGTPVLVTNFDAAIENGVVDGKTGYIFNMDMTNIDVNKIYNNIPKFEYKVNNSEKEWNDLLGKHCKPIKDKMVKVVCKVNKFWDVEYKCWRKRGESWVVDVDRARSLFNSKQKTQEGFTIMQLIDII